MARARLVDELRRRRRPAGALDARIDDALLDGAPEAARRRQLRRRLRQRRSGGDRAARHRRHQHAGRAHRRDRGSDAGADAGGGAAARRGRGDDRDGRWHGWEPEQLPALDLDGAQLGIVGLGRIGQAVARRARGFGMRIVYAQPRAAAPAVEAALGARRVSVDELVATSDIVTLHCPLSPATRHLMNAERLAAMKPRAVLVNTARGADRRRGGAGRRRSRAGTSSASASTSSSTSRACTAALVASPRAILMPHLGSSTPRTRAAMARDGGALDRRRARRAAARRTSSALER